MAEDKEKYADAIKRLIPINDLSEQLQNEVMEFAHFLEFKKKQFVFKEGDTDEYSSSKVK